MDLQFILMIIKMIITKLSKVTLCPPSFPPATLSGDLNVFSICSLTFTLKFYCFGARFFHLAIAITRTAFQFDFTTGPAACFGVCVVVPVCHSCTFFCSSWLITFETNKLMITFTFIVHCSFIRDAFPMHTIVI